MNRRFVVTAMVIAASMLTSEAMYAAPAAVHSPVLAMFSHEKTVSFSMKNATSTPITVKVGDKEMTVAPGQTVPMKLPVGMRVVAVNDTANHPAGTLVVEVASQLSDATITLN